MFQKQYIDSYIERTYKDSFITNYNTKVSSVFVNLLYNGEFVSLQFDFNHQVFPKNVWSVEVYVLVPTLAGQEEDIPNP